MPWIIVRSGTFKRRYKRKTNLLQDKVKDAIRLLVAERDPRDVGRLKHGSNKDCYGYDINDDCRILYYVDFKEKKIHFLRVCTHKQVY